LKGEDVDWTNNTVGFTRKKSGVPVLVHLGADALNVFKDLPAEGVLFPYLSRVRAGDRATEFGQRCRQLGITGITLHIAEADFGIDSQRQQFFPACKMVFEPPVFAPRGSDQQKQAFAVGNFVWLGSGLGVTGLRIRKRHLGVSLSTLGVSG
jgi:hypothetical protein